MMTGTPAAASQFLSTFAKALKSHAAADAEALADASDWHYRRRSAAKGRPVGGGSANSSQKRSLEDTAAPLVDAWDVDWLLAMGAERARGGERVRWSDFADYFSAESLLQVGQRDCRDLLLAR